MKVAMIVIIFMSVLFYSKYINNINNIEIEILNLYKDDFEEYLEFDDNYNLSIDEKVLKKYIESLGCEVDIVEKENCFDIIISFKEILTFEKRYRFSKEINNEK